jgi:hypothetical protein
MYLKRIQCEGVEWIELAQSSSWRASMNMLIKLHVT